MLNSLKKQVALQHDIKMNELGISKNPYISEKDARLEQKKN